MIRLNGGTGQGWRTVLLVNDLQCGLCVHKHKIHTAICFPFATGRIHHECVIKDRVRRASQVQPFRYYSYLELHVAMASVCAAPSKYYLHRTTISAKSRCWPVDFSPRPLASLKTMVNDKYIGLALAVSSSLAIGTSFIITKKVRL